MTIRKIVGVIETPNGTPWINAQGVIRFSGSYTPTTQYPGFTLSYITDYLGRVKLPNSPELGINLWCNEEGDIDSFYTFVLPDGNEFKFSLPVGNEDIPLSALRTNGFIPGTPEYESVIAYVLNNISIQFNYQLFSITNNQTTFTLNSIPIEPNKSKLYLNGVKQIYSIDYNINLSTLNWFGVSLSSDDILEIYYL